MLRELPLSTFMSRVGTGVSVPVYKEYLADMETPVSVLAKFASDPHAFLLESVEGGERWGRYSFIGVDPYAVVTEREGTVVVEEGGSGRRELPGADGLTVLRDLLARNRPAPSPELPPFHGGAMGYVAYDAVRKFEPTVGLTPEPGTPQLCFLLTDTIIAFDNVKHTVLVSVCARPADHPSPEAAYAAARERIDALHARLAGPRPAPDAPAPRATVPSSGFMPEMPRERFLSIVEACKRAIRDGEVIQVVPSQKFTMETDASPLSLYRALRLVNPSPYTFFLKFGERILIGASPEELVKLTGRTASVRPIAGTRPRGATEQDDTRLQNEMLESEKERAEHVMLVDLGRNDLGRVSVPGSVQVKEYMTVERYSHVMHLVSHVESQLEEGADAFDLLRATFPAGTLSGAPKVRAMQLIAELESSPRGVYGGAAGYFGYSGDMDFCIVIRTMALDGRTLSVRAGCGIVADSDPADEYQETLNKARAIFRAVELAGSLE